MLSERETMNHISPAALVFAMVLLLVMGSFLAHMISSQEQDAPVRVSPHRPLPAPRISKVGIPARPQPRAAPMRLTGEHQRAS